jgi:DNA mismatch endonuclease (patch repair protein)
MADVFDKKTRSRIMSSISSTNTKPELFLRKILRAKKLRFSTYSKLPGTPDIVFRKNKLAVFVDGEFWHGYNWLKKGKTPKSAFWKRKILRNIARDKKVNRELRRMGWRHVRVLDSQVMKKQSYVLSRIMRSLGKL